MFSMVCRLRDLAWSIWFYIIFRNGCLCRSGTNTHRSWKSDFKYPCISPPGIRSRTTRRLEGHCHPAWAPHRCSPARLWDWWWADKATERGGSYPSIFQVVITWKRVQIMNLSHEIRGGNSLKVTYPLLHRNNGFTTAQADFQRRGCKGTMFINGHIQLFSTHPFSTTNPTIWHVLSHTTHFVYLCSQPVDCHRRKGL